MKLVPILVGLVPVYVLIALLLIDHLIERDEDDE